MRGKSRKRHTQLAVYVVTNHRTFSAYESSGVETLAVEVNVLAVFLDLASADRFAESLKKLDPEKYEWIMVKRWGVRK